MCFSWNFRHMFVNSVTVEGRVVIKSKETFVFGFIVFLCSPFAFTGKRWLGQLWTRRFSIPIVPLFPSPWWTVIGSDRGRSRAAGGFSGQLTDVAWRARIRCFGVAGVLGISAAEVQF
ncbi:hypothetical protein ACOSQ2_005288 [Xanthoceras sorbifolium]